MKILTLKLILISVLVFCLADCSNSSGPQFVNSTVTGNQPPGVPGSPSPHDSSTNVSNNITLLWQCTDPNIGDTLHYDVYFSDIYPPSRIDSNLVNPAYGVGLVDHNSRFFWKIVAKDNHGLSTNGPVWTLWTAP
jgi:hypothetical protein